MALIDCSECSRQVSDKAASCPHCGAPVAANAQVMNSAPMPHRVQVVQVGKSRSFAVLLAIFLGGIGAHKFYLDQPGWGIIYLVFCWTFVPVFLGVIEGLLYLGMSDDGFRRRYG